MIACVCRAAAAAAPASKWHSAVRVAPGGHVLEPASGSFDVTVVPGANVQAAVDRCPSGGCVLLLPGTHAGPLRLLDHWKVVLVFGRGRATLQTAAGDVVTSRSVCAILDGLVILREAAGGDRGQGVCIKEGSLRLQACDVTSKAGDCVFIEGGCSDPVLASCKCVCERVLSRDVSTSRGGGWDHSNVSCGPSPAGEGGSCFCASASSLSVPL